LENRGAFLAVLSADMTSTTMVGPTVRTGQLAPDDPLAREWNVIVLGPHYAVAVTARALDDPAAGDNRRFEYVVTHDRDLIIRAAFVLWARIPKREPTLSG
jgi:DICT domain-containing protein